jgi:hypothetical protein
LDKHVFLSFRKPFGFKRIVGSGIWSVPIKDEGIGMTYRKKNTIKDHRIVKAPRVRKMIFHGAKDPLWYPTAQATRPLKIGATTFRMIAFRAGCSFGLYHIATTNVTAGMRRASNPPRRNLQTNNPPKSVHAAMHISRIPQHMTLNAK